MNTITKIFFTIFFFVAKLSLCSHWTQEDTVTYYCPYGHAECTDYHATPSYKCKHAAQKDVETFDAMVKQAKEKQRKKVEASRKPNARTQQKMEARVKRRAKAMDTK